MAATLLSSRADTENRSKKELKTRTEQIQDMDVEIHCMTKQAQPQWKNKKHRPKTEATSNACEQRKAKHRHKES